MRLSFEVRAGLLMRQVHHWAAVIFVASIVVHAARVFFTGPSGGQGRSTGWSGLPCFCWPWRPG